MIHILVPYSNLSQADPPAPPPPAPEETASQAIPPWDLAFLTMDKSLLYELLKAAFYLEVAGLVDLACQTVANKIKGGTDWSLQADPWPRKDE